MIDMYDVYEKYVRPTMVVEEPTKNDEELFKLEEETKETQPKPSTSFDENALVEKITASILEKLSINKDKETTQDGD